MTAGRPAPQDEDELGLVVALTLPLVARSGSPDSSRIPSDLATHLSTFDAQAVSFVQPAVPSDPVADEPSRGSATKPPR